MANPYVLRVLRFANSERFPILVKRSTAEPIFNTCVYCISELRTQNLASSTIDSVLRALMVLFIFFDARKIDFRERLRQGTGLLIWEIDELMSQCKKPLELLVEELDSIPGENKSVKRIMKLENVRQNYRAVKDFEPVSNAGARARYIRNYLAWQMDRQISIEAENETKKLLIIHAKKSTIEGIDARIPTDRKRDDLDHREGLDEKNYELLKKIVRPDSELNPWKGEFFRYRNFLCVLLLGSLGIRRGELLGLQIEDIKLSDQTIKIYRKADNPNDPRLVMPQTKTLDRVLPLSDELTDLIRYYIMFIRCQKVGANKRDFLIISSGRGNPMATRTLNAIFEGIVRFDPVLFSNLSPHVLRHTLNDALSEHFDFLKLSTNDEIKLRNQMMGWGPKSKMAETYTKRHTRKKANKVLLDVQKNIGVKLDI